MSVRIFSAALMLSAAAVYFPANAADLGGDCCADLEERVAELEATTARKGNRKVSLTVYGQVTTAVMYWDAQRTRANGTSIVDEQNTYVVDPQTSGTRFGFRGSAKFAPDWEAGYNIELQWQPADAGNVRVNADDAPDLPEFRQSYWFIKNKDLGRIAVGFTDTANSSIAEIDLSKASIADAMSSSQAGGLIVSEDLSGPGLTNYEFNRQSVVRYDSPTIAGFVVTAAWGEDDIWDVGLRYAGELGDFKIAAGIAYGETTDGSNGTAADPAQEILNGGLSVMHIPTGLFVTASAGQRERANWRGEDTFWFVSGGIEQKWVALGKTTLFGMGGEQNERDAVDANFNGVFAANEVDGDAATFWGLGAVQQIDAAAMELFLSYRRYDITNGAVPAEDIEFDVVVGGGRIRF